MTRQHHVKARRSWRRLAMRALATRCAVVAAAICLGTTGLACDALADVAVLNASADGTLYESATNAESSGAGPTLFVGRIFQSGGLLRRGLVQFELPDSIPTGAVIESVELGMRLSRTAPDLEETTLTLHRVLQPWGEGASNAGGLGGLGVAATVGDVTWTKNIYPTTDWAQAGGSFVDTPSAAVSVNELGDFAWESSEGLVDDVQLWLSQPEFNHGWLIRGDEAQLGTAVRLDTRENANAAARPSLRITYSAPEPDALVLVTIGCLGLALIRRPRLAMLCGSALALCLSSSAIEVKLGSGIG